MESWPPKLADVRKLDFPLVDTYSQKFIPLSQLTNLRLEFREVLYDMLANVDRNFPESV